MLRPLFIFACLALTLTNCQKNSSEEAAKLMANLEDMDGNPIQESGSGNERLLVHFWATWCKPCLEELPALVRAQDNLEKNKFRNLLVSEESPEEITYYLAKKKIYLEAARYTDPLSNLKIHALPATFIFNEQGEKVFSKSGRIDWDSEQEIQQILTLH